MRQQRIVVLGTGGTIAGRATSAGDEVGYRAGEVAIADLVQGLEAAEGLQLVTEQVAQIDSKDMDFAVWCALAGRCAYWLAQPDVTGLVVTHGTDTMEETAFFLQCVLAPSRPVVLTGAMRPATALAPDGPRNLADAIAVAASRSAQGVSVVFAGTVHGAADVQKEHGWRLDAFSSGDAGAIAYVEARGLRQLRAWPQATALRGTGALPAPEAWPRVEIVLNHAGAGGAVVRALVADGVRGLVVAATGNGTLHHGLEAALLEAQAAGVAVRRSSRCPQGRVIPHAADRLPAAEGLSPVKARIALMLELMA